MGGFESFTIFSALECGALLRETCSLDQISLTVHVERKEMRIFLRTSLPTGQGWIEWARGLFSLRRIHWANAHAQPKMIENFWLKNVIRLWNLIHWSVKFYGSDGRFQFLSAILFVHSRYLYLDRWLISPKPLAQIWMTLRYDRDHGRNGCGSRDTSSSIILDFTKSRVFG